jgi:hypothetical protein
MYSSRRAPGEVPVTRNDGGCATYWDFGLIRFAMEYGRHVSSARF